MSRSDPPSRPCFVASKQLPALIKDKRSKHTSSYGAQLAAASNFHGKSKRHIPLIELRIRFHAWLDPPTAGTSSFSSSPASAIFIYNHQPAFTVSISELPIIIDRNETSDSGQERASTRPRATQQLPSPAFKAPKCHARQNKDQKRSKADKEALQSRGARALHGEVHDLQRDQRNITKVKPLR